MADSRNFTALDWVTGEITETLNQAQQSLEAYVSNLDDPAQLKFCLNYLHQVYSILQMVEFHGGSLLAEELEKLAQALVDGKVGNPQEAFEILMRAILQLPAYLDRVKASRRDDPSSLLPLLNDLRAVRGGAFLTESSLFSPNMSAARNIKGAQANLSDEKFLEAAKKLRQLYQVALLSIIKEKDYDSNLPRLEKVFNNFEKICQGTRYQPLWQISQALVEGLSLDGISAGAAINNLLREIEKVIKELSSKGKPALEQFESEELIKNLLYYIAGSKKDTPRIRVIKDVFQLDNALPKMDSEDGLLGGVDPEAMRSVVVALTEEFKKIKEVFDSYVNKKEENNDALKKILPIFKQAADTLAILGQGGLRKNIEQLSKDMEEIVDQKILVTGNGLMDAAAKLLEVEGSLNAQFNRDAKDKDGAPPSMDVAMLSAQETVLFECQNGLEQAKDAIVEFIASQWELSHIQSLPKLLGEIRGSLEMVNQRRSARVLGACTRYIKEKLIDGNHKPDWREMDTLADAIAGVEYYLETLDQDVIEEEDTILSVAEESVGNLGYAVAVYRKSTAEEHDGLTEELEGLQDLSSLDELEEIAEGEIDLSAIEEGLGDEDGEVVKRGQALTKEKLAEILSGEKKKEPDSEKDSKKAEAAIKQAKRDAAVKATEDALESGPLLSDEEFESVSTDTGGLELETDFSFDGMDNQAIEPVDSSMTIELSIPTDDDGLVAGDDYGVIDFESAADNVDAPIESVEKLLEIVEISLPEENISYEMAEATGVESVEVPAIEAQIAVASVEDEGELIIDSFEEDFDDEIAEIFIEEVEEVLQHIHEFYPQWKSSDCRDENSLKEFRRGFHTMKGSGRMAKALSVGELAWSVENMLNRVMDGSIKIKPAGLELIERVLEKVPFMMEAYKNKLPDPDPVLSRRYRLIGEALSKGENPLPFTFGEIAVELGNLASQMEDEELTEEPDWDLWDIFVSEAETHLVVADEWIEYAKSQSPIPVDPTDPLQRAMHTLKGSAYMAELKSIGDLATPLEKFIKALRAFQIQVGDDFIHLLDECAAEIRIGLEQINKRQIVSLPNTDQLHQKINVMRLALTGESEDELSSDLTNVRKATLAGSAKVDPSMWNAFLASDMDALMDAADLLDVWQGKSSDPAPVEQLMAELTKMADAAEPAGLLPIASLSRLINKAYTKVLSANGLGQSELLPIVLTGHEALVNFIDELAGGQDIRPHLELEQKLQKFIGTSAEPEDSFGEELTLDQLDEPEKIIESTELELINIEPVDIEVIADVVEIDALAASDAPVFSLTSPTDFDMELLEIFLEEASDLLDELDGVIATWNDDPSDASHADGLKRILHTYKGGARMAGLSVLGTLAHDLETQLETFSGVADRILFNQIYDYQDRLIKGTERARNLMAGNAVNFEELGYVGDIQPASTHESQKITEAEFEIDPVVELTDESGIEEVIDFSVPEAEVDIEETSIEASEEEPIELAVSFIEPKASLAASEILEYSEDIDTELLGIFIEEATELLEELDSSIAEWQQNPSDGSFVDALKRILHTLKGGARMSGMTGLGSLAHDLETYLETFSGSGDDALFSMLHSYQERITKGVEQALSLAVGEIPAAASEYESAAESSSAEEESLTNEFSDEPRLDLTTTLASSEAGAAILSFRAVDKPRGLDEQADKKEAAARAARDSAPQEMVKISADLVDQLVNLAGETSISRGRVEQQVIDFGSTLGDVEATIRRMQDQLRRMEIETEAQVQSKIEEMKIRQDDFDPLEMDHYSTLQQLTRSLMETSSDLIDLRSQLTNKARETEMILLQQSRINTELQESLMRSRMVPFSRMVPRLRRIVRQVSGELKKEVDFDLVNVEGEMDRTVLERMVAPLEHMLRNAMDHGIEVPADREKKGKNRRGRVVLSFGREGGDVVITLKDDGGGIPVDKVRAKAIERGLITAETELSNHEILQFIMQAGFSTAEKVTQISGRGVGMDVVHSEIKQLGGNMTINSEYGHGTEFVVRLPFTVSINRALMVRIGDDLYAVPLNSIEGIVRVSPFELENYYQDRSARFEYAGDLFEVRYLGAMLHTKERPNLEGLVLPESVILVRGADHSIALHVDQLLGSREIVVKSLGPQFGGVPGLSGATILGDGSVVVILDLMELVRSTILSESGRLDLDAPKKVVEQEKVVTTVMVVDDSVTVRKVTSRFLEREGFEVVLAKDGADAMLQLQDIVPDVMLLDIEMPRMDGFEVATSVKNTERLKRIPIIMITSRTGEKHRERALSIGVERYMGKPFVEEELLETINQLLAEKMRKLAVKS